MLRQAAGERVFPDCIAPAKGEQVAIIGNPAAAYSSDFIGNRSEL
jgi:hypothetical protein